MIATVQKIASSLPDVEEGIACAGTALESRTYKARKKAFVFLGPRGLRLKLRESLAEVKRHGFEPGAHGWVLVDLDAKPARALLKKWIEESYRVVAGDEPKKARRTR